LRGAEPFGAWARAANYSTGHQDFGGLVVPTRRRVYLRRTDGCQIHARHSSGSMLRTWRSWQETKTNSFPATSSLRCTSLIVPGNVWADLGADAPRAETVLVHGDSAI
jgi:hypothetical protein